MDYFEDTPDSEEGHETFSGPETECSGVILESLGMQLVRSSLAGDAPCNCIIPGWNVDNITRLYYAHEDFYLLNTN